MEQLGGGKNVHRGKAKVRLDVLVDGVGDDARMTDGINARLVDPGVQRRHVRIQNGLVVRRQRMERHGAHSPPEKGISGFKGWYQLQGGQKHLHLFGGLDQLIPFTFPHFDHAVPVRSEGLGLDLSGTIEFIQRAVGSNMVFCVTELGVTPLASMPQASMKFVDGSRGRVVTVHKIRRW